MVGTGEDLCVYQILVARLGFAWPDRWEEREGGGGGWGLQGSVQCFVPCPPAREPQDANGRMLLLLII